jgi:hypothetical protein
MSRRRRRNFSRIIIAQTRQVVYSSTVKVSLSTMKRRRTGFELKHRVHDCFLEFIKNVKLKNVEVKKASGDL